MNGGSATAVSLPSQMSTTHAVNLASSANTHVYQVKATDCVGNATPFKPGMSVRLTAFQDVNAGIKYTAAWARGNAPLAFGGSIHSTSHKGASATFKFTGRQVAYVATRAANRGTAHVYLDGKLVANVDLHSATVDAPPDRLRPRVGGRRRAHDQDRLRRDGGPRHGRRRRLRVDPLATGR